MNDNATTFHINSLHAPPRVWSISRGKYYYKKNVLYSRIHYAGLRKPIYMS